MKSLKHLGNYPVSTVMSADDVLEFHAARLLLLLKFCGISNRIDGLTKMAKLDFFVRYPDFFEAAKKSVESVDVSVNAAPGANVTESAMVRHHYGPWDKRYYQVLAHLEAKGLVAVEKDGNAYRLSLTGDGVLYVEKLAAANSFLKLIERMRDVKSVFGKKSGDSLKRLIYDLFDSEIGSRKLGKVIRK